MHGRAWLRMLGLERRPSTACGTVSRRRLLGLAASDPCGTASASLSLASSGYRGLQLGTFDTIAGINPYKSDKGLIGAASTFAAAQTAITFGAGATYPFDTIRRRLQMQSEKPVEEHLYKGTMDCFTKISKEEGLAKGLYKGFVANIVRSVGGALVLVFYDRAKNA